jgi:hypothetical protein
MSSAAPITIYGYHIIVPKEESLDFIRDLSSINDTLVEPIQVYCITSHPDINEVHVVIGFIPDNHLPRNMIYLDTLREFIMDNPMFDGIDMNEKPGFYAGFIWKDDINEVESDEESETDSEDSIDSDDCKSSDIGDDYDSSDIHDETDDKPTSYYISKYYI